MAADTASTVRIDNERLAEVEDFAERKGFDNRSKAARELIDIGLRESRRPLLYRLKDRAADMVFYCILGALVAVVIGYTTDALTAPHGLRIGIVFLAIGLGILGVVELTRMLTGQSQLGAVVRGALL